MATSGTAGPEIGLLNFGADKEAECSTTGSTPLHIAAATGRAEACEVLLDAGADNEAKDNSGRTAMACAIANGHTHLAGLLQSRAEEARLREADGAPVFTRVAPAVDATGINVPLLDGRIQLGGQHKVKPWTWLMILAVCFCVAV